MPAPWVQLVFCPLTCPCLVHKLQDSKRWPLEEIPDHTPVIFLKPQVAP